MRVTVLPRRRSEPEDAGQRDRAWGSVAGVFVLEEPLMTVTITPRRPAAAAHAFSSPIVREIPPVQRPGTFDSTW